MCILNFVSPKYRINYELSLEVLQGEVFTS